MELKDKWNVESALQVLNHETVDSRIWSEAVEWLMLYGPDETRELLLQASAAATHKCFPDLKPDGYTPDGQACYRMDKLAISLGISEDEAREMVREKEQQHKIHHFIDEEEVLQPN